MQTLLIKNAHIITQNKDRDILHNYSIFIKNGKISKLSNNINIKADKTIDGSKFTILPGFINTHVHLGETIFSSFLDGRYDLEKYLKITNDLIDKTNLVEKYRDVITDYSIMNLIKNGTTTVAGARVFDTAERWGLSNVSGYMFMQSKKFAKYGVDSKNQFSLWMKGVEKSLYSSPAIFIHSLNYINEKHLLILKNIRKLYPFITIMIHIAETKKLEKEIQKEWEMDSISVLKKFKLLSKDTVLIHGNHLTEDNFSDISKNKSKIIHCLSSNLKVADNTLNIRSSFKNNINTCIATDGVATGGTFRLLQEVHLAYFYHNKFGKFSHIPIEKFFDMITIDAAKSIGLQDKIGSIEEGKNADLVFVNSNIYTDNIKNIVFNYNNIDIVGIIANGNIKMWDRNIIYKKSEKTIASDFKKLYENIKKQIQKNS